MSGECPKKKMWLSAVWRGSGGADFCNNATCARFEFNIGEMAFGVLELVVECFVSFHFPLFIAH